MTTSLPAEGAIWLRPGLRLPAHLDTALFDVDGVLIDTRRSYRLAVVHAAEHLVREVNGLREAPSPMVSAEDVALFKLAGGFNSDWDATQLFAALWTSRLREWNGSSEATVSMAEWARQASEAARAGQGGVAWLAATVPATAIPDAEVARWAHDEYYWGAALAKALYDHPSAYAPEAEGFVHNEALLLNVELLPALAARGITRYGLITGRVGPEVDWAIRRIVEVSREDDEGGVYAPALHDSPHGRSPFACIVPATLYAKPDPRALKHAVQALGARAALYAGDTADDLDLVLRYRAEFAPDDLELPPVMAVAIATGREAQTYALRGADVVIPHVRYLTNTLDMLRE
jgi:phosphoglycolate phosphatase-like HAD superfamily hydrolase